MCTEIWPDRHITIQKSRVVGLQVAVWVPEVRPSCFALFSFWRPKLQEHGSLRRVVDHFWQLFPQHGNVESFVHVVYRTIMSLACLVFLFEVDTLFVRRNVPPVRHIPRSPLQQGVKSSWSLATSMVLNAPNPGRCRKSSCSCLNHGSSTRFSTLRWRC